MTAHSWSLVPPYNFHFELVLVGLTNPLTTIKTASGIQSYVSLISCTSISKDVMSLKRTCYNSDLVSRSYPTEGRQK